MKRRAALTLVVMFLTGCGVLGNRGGSGDLAQIRTVADVPLPGDTSRFDYESYDPQAHRLYLAHLGAGAILVFDTQRGTVVGTAPGVPGVHGVLVVPDLGRVYATATSARQVAVVDTSTLAVVATVPADGYPDGLAYAPDAGKLYVSDEQGGNETVIDARTNRRVGTIALGGEAGNTQYDPASHRIYVALHAGQVATIDPATDQVIERHDAPGCSEPHGLLIDPEQGRAYVACQSNARLLAMDMPSMQVVSIQQVGADPDVLAFDPAQHLLYVAAESGDLAVFRADATGVTRLFLASAGPNAHAVAVAPDTHHAYLPLADLNGHPVLREIAVDLKKV